MGVSDADDDEDDSVQLIDNDGNLFGVINVIDALVILGVIAVVVAGVALVTGSGGSNGSSADAANETEIELNQETRYVTVTFGLQRNAFIDRLLTGQTLEVNGVNATVTDAYVYPTVDPNDPRSGLILRLGVNSTISESEFGEQVSVGGNRIRVGSKLKFAADGRNLTGRPASIDTSGTELQTERLTTEVTISNVDQRMIERIQSGQRETNLRGETVAVIESTSVQTTTQSSDSNDGGNLSNDLTLDVELLTLQTRAGNQFRGSTLREGDKIAFDLGSRIVRGTVTNI